MALIKVKDVKEAIALMMNIPRVLRVSLKVSAFRDGHPEGHRPLVHIPGH